MLKRRTLMIVTNEFIGDPRVEAESGTLVRNGVAVSVLAWDRLNEFGSAETKGGIDILWSKVPTGVEMGLKQALRMPLFWVDVVRKSWRLRIHAVHAHDLDALPAAYCLSRIKQVPLIYDAHESYPDQHVGRIPDWAVSLLRRLEGWLLRRCQAVITVGDRLAASLVERGARTVQVVGNWKQNERFSFLPEEIARAKRDLKLEGARLVIGYLGALSEERCVTQLVEALRNFPDVVGIVAGYGTLEKKISELATLVPNVRFLGKRPASDIPLLTAVSDAVYYCLKRNEGNSFYSAPNKLFEAMAAGKAILVVRGAGEIGQIVEERNLGPTVDRPDPEQLAQAVRQLLHPEKLRMWQQNAAQAYLDKYNWNRAERNLMSVYEALWARNEV
jgi:glycosyltransferase involved in cell wall biosynthesis